MDKIQKILVVEDEEDLALLMKDSLELKGFHVDTAFNGFQALNQVSSAKYDLVISDINMPGMDGVQFMRYLRVNLLNRRTPVFIVSGKMDDKDVVHLKALGASKLIEKPFDLDMICNDIQKFSHSGVVEPYSEEISAVQMEAVQTMIKGYFPTSEAEHTTTLTKESIVPDSISASSFIYGRKVFGGISITVERELLSIAAKRLFGLEVQDIDDIMMTDLMVEMANQTAGSFKNLLLKKRLFVEFSLPEVTRSSRHRVEKRTGSPISCIQSAVEDSFLWCELSLGRSVHTDFPDEDLDFEVFQRSNKEAA